MRIKSLLLRISALALIALMSYGLYQLWRINDNYAQEAAVYNQVIQYRPQSQTAASPTVVAADALSSSATEPTNTENIEPATLNQSIVDLQSRYADTLGWLTIPNTQVDYPFVQGSDNEHYLHTDLEQNLSSAGTLFTDYRNSKDFTDFNTIIFGHNMRNGSMFGTLRSFNDQAFFENNRTGTLFLKDKTYEIDIFAFAVIEYNDGIVYNTEIVSEAERAQFLDYIRDSARYYRDIGVTTDDHIVVLSTCNYEFDEARMVVVGKLS